MRAFWWLVSVVAVSCGGPIDVGDALPCSARTCANCLAHVAGCVWCDTSQTCLRSDAAEAARCRDARDSPYECGVPNPCGGVAGCASCVASGCTWYAGNGRCERYGSPLGQGDRVLTTSACPSMPGVDGGDPCPHATCSACLANSSCGWCPGTGRCVGVSSPEGRACSINLKLFEQQCPAPTPGGGGGCASLARCDACVSSSACVWCPETSTCEGSLSTCLHATVLASRCPATTQSQCDASGSSCTVCSARAGCGWCRSSRSCLLGTAGGPSRGTCASTDWYFASRLCI
ncbi:MAG: hypothetical protein U0324_44400 [Polyangiales bacterium]